VAKHRQILALQEDVPGAKREKNSWGRKTKEDTARVCEGFFGFSGTLAGVVSFREPNEVERNFY